MFTYKIGQLAVIVKKMAEDKRQAISQNDRVSCGFVLNVQIFEILRLRKQWHNYERFIFDSFFKRRKACKE